MSAKLFIKTHGCQMNTYDSDRMADLLKESHALGLTEQPEDAEVILINTCSIREKAQEKVFSELGRYRALKEKNPNVIIGVGGCVASQEGEAIRARAPFVDLVFGPQTLHRLPEMLEARRTQGDAPRVRHRLISVSLKLRSSIACLSRNLRAPAPTSASWKVAVNTVPSAWCPTPGAKKSAAL